MKKRIKHFIVLILSITSIFSLYCTPAQAAPRALKSDSSYSYSFTVTTKAKWTEICKDYPAKLTFVQTKGTCKFTDKYGRVSVSTNNGYCWYDIDYKIYANGKYVGSGHIDFYQQKQVMYLKASAFKTYKYVVTVKPHYAYVRNSRTGRYYLGYNWTRPSTYTITPTHDITNLYKNSASRM